MYVAGQGQVVKVLNMWSKHPISCILIAFCLYNLGIVAEAQPVNKRVVLRGKIAEVNLLPEESSKKVIFWGILNGNSSNVVDLRVEAPAGTKAKFLASQKSGSKGGARAIVRGKKAKKSLYPLLLQEKYRDNSKESSLFRLQRNPRALSGPRSLTAGLRIDACSFIKEEQINELLKEIENLSGESWSKERFCDYLNKGSGTEEGQELPGSGGTTGGGGNVPELPSDPSDEIFFQNASNASLDVKGVFRKDSCNSRVNKYILRVELDFSDVDLTKFPNGITARFRGMEYVYKGRRAASIKPVSDGKFAPAPLLLMQSLGYGQEIDIIKWSNGRPRKQADVKVENMVYYRGFVLSRSVASKILTGGYGSVDVEANYQSYGACLELVRRRQRVNGYPG
jgi:hypothetical protein